MSNLSAISRRLTPVLALIAACSLASCGGKKTTSDEGNVPNGPTAAEDNTMGDSDSGHAMGLQTVHFPYDSSTLDSDAKSTLKTNADILKAHASLKVQIEGHCDQRGGIQYNIALGEKRANAAKKYIEDLGIPGDRVTVISYGKERPIDNAATEEAYGKNRRDNFVVTSR